VPSVVQILLPGSIGHSIVAGQLSPAHSTSQAHDESHVTLSHEPAPEQVTLHRSRPHSIEPQLEAVWQFTVHGVLDVADTQSIVPHAPPAEHVIVQLNPSVQSMSLQPPAVGQPIVQ
jgi:hypothetical protein